jgi:hypothetical protein
MRPPVVAPPNIARVYVLRATSSSTPVATLTDDLRRSGWSYIGQASGGPDTPIEEYSDPSHRWRLSVLDASDGAVWESRQLRPLGYAGGAQVLEGQVEHALLTDPANAMLAELRSDT